MTACGSCRSRGRTERVHRSLENAHDAFPTATTGIPNVLPMCRRQKVLPMSWRRALSGRPSDGLKPVAYVQVETAVGLPNGPPGSPEGLRYRNLERALGSPGQRSSARTDVSMAQTEAFRGSIRADRSTLLPATRARARVGDR